MMKEAESLVVVGAQWGDEGKGKVIDYLSAHADVVARFQGGDNAGHTVVYGANIFKLHHVPSGVLYPGCVSVLGNGMVINPLVLVKELEELEKRGISTRNLKISSKAHLVMVYHQVYDRFNEELLGENKIGTTGRGIGPAYADKALRYGLRAHDLCSMDRFSERLEQVLPLQNRLLENAYNHKPYSLEELVEMYRPATEKLGPMITNTSLLLENKISAGKKVLFEGAQGALLDIDHGTYPFVTSSSTVAAAAGSGSGLGPREVGRVLGVLKAYTTRVGEGPFPTEDKNEAGIRLREQGREFGTTTGRPRRCGWYDAVIARYAARVNGLTGMVITKLDVLSGLETLNLAVAYRCRGSIIKEFPQDIFDLQHCEPVYEILPGWDEDLSRAKSIQELPSAARQYLEAVEEYSGIMIEMVSVGPERTQTMVKPGGYLAEWCAN